PIFTLFPYTTLFRSLRNLLERGQYTAFGKHYGYDNILSESLHPVDSFRKRVPAHNYSSMFSRWWHRCLAGEENVCWPGKVKFFRSEEHTSELQSREN